MTESPILLEVLEEEPSVFVTSEVPPVLVEVTAEDGSVLPVDAYYGELLQLEVLEQQISLIETQGGEPALIEIYAPGGAGVSGPITSTYYRHDQLLPSAGWSVVHGLGRFPTVEVIINSESVGAPVTYVDLNTVYISFATPQTGIAVFS